MSKSPPPKTPFKQNESWLQRRQERHSNHAPHTTRSSNLPTEPRSTARAAASTGATSACASRGSRVAGSKACRAHLRRVLGLSAGLPTGLAADSAARFQGAAATATSGRRREARLTGLAQQLRERRFARGSSECRLEGGGRRGRRARSSGHCCARQMVGFPSRCRR